MLKKTLPYTPPSILYTFRTRQLIFNLPENVSDVVNMGDVFDVKYFGQDPRTRKEKVSRKALLEKPEGYVARPPRDDSRGRDNKRRDDRKPRSRD